MSGFCSAHRDHDPDCAACDQFPTPAPPGAGWFRVENSDEGIGGPGWMRCTSQGNDYRADADRENARRSASMEDSMRQWGK